ncbi:MAG: hypothetical protein V1861_03135 [Candidatus Micrarchaeota archaeon]
MKHAFIVLLIVGLAAAFTVKPAYIEIHDTGNENLPALNVDISIDCDTKNVHINVASNETGEPLEGAMTYLFYTDYTYQALPNPGKTDVDGNTAIPVPGTIRFLNAMFILRVDKQGYRSREIEFAYKKCFETPPKPPEPPQTHNETNATNQTAPQNVTPPANITPPVNETKPPVPPLPPENVTDKPQPDGRGEPGASFCPVTTGLVILAASLALKRG